MSVGCPPARHFHGHRFHQRHGVLSARDNHNIAGLYAGRGGHNLFGNLLVVLPETRAGFRK